MLWLGRWCADMAPDYIVQLGDWLTLDSLSTHANPGSITKMIQPPVHDDLVAGEQSLQMFTKGLGGYGGKRIIVYGNHEYRAHRYEDRFPELQGVIVGRLDGLFEAADFRIVPYGEYVFIEGVGFTHHVNNTLGRPYGGKTAAQRIATDSVFSTVSGHTHQRHSVAVPKIGPNANVRAISAGCALPSGYVEHYAKHATTGWEYGAMWLSICEGVILDEHWFSMELLEERYREKKTSPANRARQGAPSAKGKSLRGVKRREGLTPLRHKGTVRRKTRAETRRSGNVGN